MTLRFFALFFTMAIILAAPPLYQVECPTCHGTGMIPMETSGMESVKLTGFDAVVVSIVRLGCGLYAIYTINVTLTFSNSAPGPVNASVSVASSDKKTGASYYKYPLTYEVPANATDFTVFGEVPSKMYVGSSGILPTLAFNASLFEASNITIYVPCPTCGGSGTISFLRKVLGGS